MNKLNESLYTVSKSGERTFWIEFKEKNQKQESLVIELTKCEVPEVWHKNKYVSKDVETYWSSHTYVEDSEGFGNGGYNIQHKLSDDKKRFEVDFNWVFEATEENKEKLLSSIYNLFITATGKSATEKKLEKIKEYAKKHNIEVVTEIPEGWVRLDYATDPVGCVSIGNTNKILKAIKEGTFKRKLLLV